MSDTEIKAEISALKGNNPHIKFANKWNPGKKRYISSLKCFVCGEIDPGNAPREELLSVKETIAVYKHMPKNCNDDDQQLVRCCDKCWHKMGFCSASKELLKGDEK